MIVIPARNFAVLSSKYQQDRHSSKKRRRLRSSRYGVAPALMLMQMDEREVIVAVVVMWSYTKVKIRSLEMFP